MGAATPKVFLPLRGLSVLSYSLRTVSKLDHLSRIVVAVANEHRGTATTILAAEDQLSTMVDLVSGGEERQDSVSNALAAINDPVDLILVHDGARPLVSISCMQRCVATAAKHGAAIVAVAANDTVKICNGSLVDRTIERNRVWLAQTPQVFRSDWLREAYARAERESLRATDDSTLVESCGYPVQIVEGEATNRKLTTPDDLRWAEWYLDQTHT